MRIISVSEWLVQDKLRKRIAELERRLETPEQRAAREAENKVLIARLKQLEAEGYCKLASNN